MAARLQPLRDQADQFGQLAAGAADKHRVRIRPAVQQFGRLGVEQAVVAQAKRRMVGLRNGKVARVLLDGKHMALLTQARRFQPHRAAAGTNVPHHARSTQLQPRQRNGTHFLLGDQPLVGLALGKGAVGLTGQ